MSRKEIVITTKEAQRQMLIIEELKQIVQKQKEKLGRQLFYALTSYGCQMTFTH